MKIRPALEEDKEAVLLALCTRTFKEKVIVFRFVASYFCSKSLDRSQSIVWTRLSLKTYTNGEITSNVHVTNKASDWGTT